MGVVGGKFFLSRALPARALTATGAAHYDVVHEKNYLFVPAKPSNPTKKGHSVA